MIEDLSALAAERMREAGVPGVAIGVLDGDQEHTAGLGVTSVEHPLEVTPATLFQIGSITKTVVGTVAVRLTEQGLLDLDAPLRTYLPALRLADETAAAGVTMRHVLTHTGGWAGDYFDDTGPGDDALDGIIQRLDRLEQLTPLGEVWAYNNAGFYLAGRAIEIVTGTSFETAVREHALVPVGMERSWFGAADVITQRFAVGHLSRDGIPAVARPWAIARAANPAGGLVSSVEDLLRYARFHLAEGEGPIAAMRAPQVEIGGVRDEAVGLAWFLRERGGRQIVSHGGATLGQVSLLMLVPDERFAVTVATNSDHGGRVTLAVARAALAAFRGIEDADPPPVEREPEELAEYAGRYTAQLQEVVIEPDRGGLRATLVLRGGFPTPESPPPPPLPPGGLVFHDRDRISGRGELEGAHGEFLRDEAGRIVWFRFGGRLHRPEPSTAGTAGRSS